MSSDKDNHQAGRMSTLAEGADAPQKTEKELKKEQQRLAKLAKFEAKKKAQEEQNKAKAAAGGEVRISV